MNKNLLIFILIIYKELYKIVIYIIHVNFINIHIKKKHNKEKFNFYGFLKLLIY